MISKIVSGGAPGAEKGALISANIYGITTTGTAPKGYKTYLGVDESLKFTYNLIESSNYGYTNRVKSNINRADATLIFCKDILSSKILFTEKYCTSHNKPYFIYDFFDPHCLDRLKTFILKENISTINVTGDTEKQVPGITRVVALTMEELFIYLKKLDSVEKMVVDK